MGGAGHRFFDSNNWFNCGLLDAPTPALPIYFGPVEPSINGVPQGVQFPTSPSIVSGNFISPSLRIANGLNFTLVVQDSVYTCPTGVIGDAPLVGDPGVGTATLVLDNAVWDGSLTIGQGGGRGSLVLRNGGRVTGGIVGGGGVLNISNGGDLELIATLSGSGGAHEIVTTSGGVLTLSASFTSAGLDDVLVNEPGGTIVKPGDGSFKAINWRFVNNGDLRLLGGSLVILDPTPQMTGESSILSGNGTLTLTQADAIFNKGTIAPGLASDDDLDGFVIDVPFIKNDDTAVFRVQAGVQAGKLTTPGIFDIGGTLEVVRFGDFEPDGTEEFTIIEAGFSTGAFGSFFTNAVPVQGTVAHDVVSGDLQFDVVYTSTSVVIRNLSVFVPPCNLADLAGPGGVLDLADVDAFITLFLAGDPSVDLVATFGVIDLADIDAFITSFLAGCP